MKCHLKLDIDITLHYIITTLPEEDPATPKCNMHKNLVKIGQFQRYDRGKTNTHTHRQTHTHTHRERERERRFIGAE